VNRESSSYEIQRDGAYSSSDRTREEPLDDGQQVTISLVADELVMRCHCRPRSRRCYRRETRRFFGAVTFMARHRCAFSGGSPFFASFFLYVRTTPRRTVPQRIRIDGSGPSGIARRIASPFIFRTISSSARLMVRSTSLAAHREPFKNVLVQDDVRALHTHDLTPCAPAYTYAHALLRTLPILACSGDDCGPRPGQESSPQPLKSKSATWHRLHPARVRRAESDAGVAARLQGQEERSRSRSKRLAFTGG